MALPKQNEDVYLRAEGVWTTDLNALNAGETVVVAKAGSTRRVKVTKDLIEVGK